MNKSTIPTSDFNVICLKCGHAWLKRIFNRPARCPKCKRYDYDEKEEKKNE